MYILYNVDRRTYLHYDEEADRFYEVDKEEDATQYISSNRAEGRRQTLVGNWEVVNLKSGGN
jgi:hypothetical protein